MLKILIADDETLARQTIKLLLVSETDIAEIYEAQDGNTAVKIANEIKPDIVFLDIEMPGISGLEVVKHMPEQCVVIFATAYNEFAVTAFELNAIDYLLKPFEDERFYSALEKARQKIHEGKKEDLARVGQLFQKMFDGQHTQYRDRLVIRDLGRIRLIDIEKITYICGAGNYAEIHLDDGKKILHRETLSVLESQLDPLFFVRIHRSSIVRRSSVSELRPNEKGNYSVILVSGAVLTLSRRNRSKLDELTH